MHKKRGATKKMIRRIKARRVKKTRPAQKAAHKAHRAHKKRRSKLTFMQAPLGKRGELKNVEIEQEKGNHNIYYCVIRL